MSFFKFITHPKRSTDLFNTIQTTQILYPQRRKKSYETNPAQEKQHKEFILTDSNAYKPNFMTDDLRNFMYNKHNGDNPIL